MSVAAEQKDYLACPLCKLGYKPPHSQKDWEEFYASQKSSATESPVREEGGSVGETPRV